MVSKIEEIKQLQISLDSVYVNTFIALFVVFVVMIMLFMSTAQILRDNSTLVFGGGIIAIIIIAFFGYSTINNLGTKITSLSREITIELIQNMVKVEGFIIGEDFKKCETYEGCIELGIETDKGTQTLEVHTDSLTDIDEREKVYVEYPEISKVTHLKLGEIEHYELFYDLVNIKNVKSEGNEDDK